MTEAAKEIEEAWVKTDQDFMVDVRRLAGVAELAHLFKVGRTTVSNWNDRRDRNGFPAPLVTLAMGPIWDLNEVVIWYGGYIPSKGGRPGAAPRDDGGRYVRS